jgi:general secretion pathway protein L
MANVSAANSGASQLLAARWQGFARWWLSSLKEIAPQAWRNWADSEAQPQVLVQRDGESVVCRLTSASGAFEARLPAAGFDSAALGIWLEHQGMTRDGVIVGPIIARDLFLVRELSVPKAALGVLPKILDQEVVRRTPFQLSEIWHAASAIATGTDDVVAMRHWIIRKDRAEVALTELGLSYADVDFLAVGDTGGEALPVIHFRSSGDEDPPWSGRAVRLLAGAAFLASVCGVAVFEWRQASVAAAIETELAEARQGAQNGRDGIDPAGRLFAIKADVSVLEVWDELSRILPDHTFLTEARIADGKVTMTGFSSDAARLVRIIDQSPLFSGAALTAAIISDATEHKDRFSISFKVRGGRPGAGSRSTPP